MYAHPNSFQAKPIFLCGTCKKTKFYDKHFHEFFIFLHRPQKTWVLHETLHRDVECEDIQTIFKKNKFSILKFGF
jgi:hypothetical protein